VAGARIIIDPETSCRVRIDFDPHAIPAKIVSGIVLMNVSRSMLVSLFFLLPLLSILAGCGNFRIVHTLM
jgi:hypothetical protein